MTTTRPPAPFLSIGLIARLLAAVAAILVCAYFALYLGIAALMTCFSRCSSTDELVGWLIGCCAAALLACGPLAAGRLLGGRTWGWVAAAVLVIGAVGSGYVVLSGS